VDPGKWLNPDELQRVTDAIGEAEKQTSAEIKLLVLRHCWIDIHQKARQLFVKHGLDKTELRNAVLILVVTTDRQFLIHGDVGIDEKVGQRFWAGVRDHMLEQFKAGRNADALCQGIKQIGQKLIEFFPRQEGDVNEICDKPVAES